MTQGRLVPWSSWEEWRKVGEGLFSEDEEQNMRAIQRVHTWRTRGRLPLGIDVTACLQETRLRDPEFRRTVPRLRHRTADAEGLSESMLRLQYAMTIVRMVNGIADSSQKGRLAASVADLAESAGIPRVLVDLRHEASHNELPQLAPLRLGAARALAWLRASYWRRQHDHTAACQQRIAALLKDFVALRRAAMLKAAGLGADAPGALDDAEGDHSDLRGGGQEGSSGPGAGSAGGGYQAAEGQKARRALLGELRAAVPAPAASLLVPLLLDGGILDPPLSTMPAQPDPSDEQKAQQVAEIAWRASLQALGAQWPSLLPLLLHGAVQRLAEQPSGPTASETLAPLATDNGEAHGGTSSALWEDTTPEAWDSGAAGIVKAGQSSGGTDGHAAAGEEDGRVDGAAREAVLVEWVRRLCDPALREAEPPAKKQGKGVKRKATEEASEGSWRPSAEQVRELLSACVAAFAKVPQRRKEGTIAPAGTSAQNGGLAAACEVLLEVPSAGGGAKAAAVRQQVQLLMGLASPEVAATEAVPQLDAPAASIPELSRALEAASAAQQTLFASKKGLLTAPPKPDSSANGAPSLRWRRASTWTLCAIGALPSAFDPNGQMPDLTI